MKFKIIAKQLVKGDRLYREEDNVIEEENVNGKEYGMVIENRNRLFEYEHHLFSFNF